MCAIILSMAVSSVSVCKPIHVLQAYAMALKSYLRCSSAIVEVMKVTLYLSHNTPSHVINTKKVKVAHTRLPIVGFRS